MNLYFLFSSFRGWWDSFRINSPATLMRKKKEEEARKLRRKHRTRMPMQKVCNSSYQKQLRAHSHRRV